MHRFQDRGEAGELLAQHLKSDFVGQSPILVALTRGGVAVAYPIAKKLGIPLDLLVVRKLRAPGQNELAIGAVASGGFIYLNQDLINRLGIEGSAVENIKNNEIQELLNREAQFFGSKSHIPWMAREVIIVDDGIATGATMEVAIRAVKAAQPKSITVAVPVAALSAIERLHRLVDHVLAIQMPSDLGAVGEYYQLFPQLTNQEVIDILEKSRRETPVYEHTE